jgi:hypothetical protein
MHMIARKKTELPAFSAAADLGYARDQGRVLACKRFGDHEFQGLIRCILCSARTVARVYRYFCPDVLLVLYPPTARDPNAPLPTGLLGRGAKVDWSVL